MQLTTNPNDRIDPTYTLVLAGVISCLLLAMFSEALVWMAKKWFSTEEYSHGMMIPFVCLYLVWQRRAKLVHDTSSLNSLGIFLFILGLSLFIVSDLATIYAGVHVAFLFVLYGLVITAIGWKNTREIIVPLFVLAFMIPVPAFINNNLSSQLQLISSELGVAFIRLFDITVYLEGNVIDLGAYKLQVVDACSGLRYLYPLIALGFILAYLCRIPLWMRVVIFLSTIPITVIMNSIRIGAIGVSVEYWGPEMAEGLLHDVEGWFMFMASLVVLLLELTLLLKLTKDRRKISDLFVFEDATDTQDEAKNWNLVFGSYPKKLLILCLVLTSLVAAFKFTQTKEDEVIPSRLPLVHFPLFVGDWMGKPDTLDQIFIDELKFEDYMIADYQRGHDRINFYVAYYESQKKGESAHSPRSCIPGGGWVIDSIETVQIGDMYLNSQPLMANRTVIRKGDIRQVVYYWFQQRGRIITNEYLVKWYIFLDALTLNRTDGALVRLTVPLNKQDDLDKADEQVLDFMSQIQFRMNDFVPN